MMEEIVHNRSSYVNNYHRSEARRLPMGRRQSRQLDSGRPPRLSLQPARLRPAHHQHRRRQHLGQARRRTIRSPANRSTVLWVKGSGGDLRTSKRENFSSLYQDKLLGAAADLRGDESTAAPRRAVEDRHGGLLSALHLQSQSARPVHRYAAASLRSAASTSITCIRTR